MKDRVNSDIGTKERLRDWADIDWKQVKKKVRNLRQRIYRATQNKEWNKVRSLMKLMLRSDSNLLLSVRRVTQDNQGKLTPGIDKEIALEPRDRVALTNKMRNHNIWKVKPTRRIYIPKSNGKQRPLGIPTIQDRVAQAIVKNSLEPHWEAQFESHSYGFRPGRSCHDAIVQVWTRCNNTTKDTWIFDADIKGAFDNISHEYILKTIGQVPGRELIKQWLKAGYVEKGIFHATSSGTPQGGIISPLLANIALHGMEQFLDQFIEVRKYDIRPGSKRTSKSVLKRKRYGFIRYADDFIITAQSKEDILDIIPKVKDWLEIRGLKLNEEKTSIRHIEEGFNFLGFHIVKYGKCLTFPEKKKVLNFLKELRNWLKANKEVTPDKIVRYFNPKLRGFANYYRFGASKRIFSYIDYQVWRMLWKWAIRKHPKKGKGWVMGKYFKPYRGRSMVFTATIKDRRGDLKPMSIVSVADIPIQRHIKVKNTASPDNPELLTYWDKRRTKYGKTYWSKGTKLHKVAQNQNWKCPVCNEHLHNGEKLQTHHVIKVKDGGNDKESNLIHLHQACHYQLHRSEKRMDA